MSDSDICSDDENYGGIGAAMANSMHRRERRRERAYRARRRVMSKEEEEEENNEGRRVWGPVEKMSFFKLSI